MASSARLLRGPRAPSAPLSRPASLPLSLLPQPPDSLPFSCCTQCFLPGRKPVIFEDLLREVLHSILFMHNRSSRAVPCLRALSQPVSVPMLHCNHCLFPFGCAFLRIMTATRAASCPPATLPFPSPPCPPRPRDSLVIRSFSTRDKADPDHPLSEGSEVAGGSRKLYLVC